MTTLSRTGTPSFWDFSWGHLFPEGLFILRTEPVDRETSISVAEEWFGQEDAEAELEDDCVLRCYISRGDAHKIENEVGGVVEGLADEPYLYTMENDLLTVY